MKPPQFPLSERKEQVVQVLDCWQSFTSHDVAYNLRVSERSARSWLKALHEEGRVYISMWKEGPAGIGKKAPAYKVKTNQTQRDATKWWLL